ncbi:MAG: hypothetical protein AAFZ52_05950, partial [Bacteroidota bacterium]
YNALTLTLGTRYHFYLSERLSFFLSGAAIAGLPDRSASLTTTFDGRSFTSASLARPNLGIAFGGGIRVGWRWSLTGFYQVKRNVSAETAVFFTRATVWGGQVMYHFGG